MDPRLKPAAHEFEASLMKEFLEPLQKDTLCEENEDGSSTDNNALMDFGSEALARAISERGGFGIATRVLANFAAKKGAASGGAVPERAADSRKI
jgi:Rod binding domain-containing protein